MATNPNDDSADQAKQPRLSVAWALSSVVVGLAAALLAGRIYPEGAAEIAGIMVGSLILCARALWRWRVRGWFAPLVIGWMLLHAVLLTFVVVPMNIHESKALINLVWVEFFAFGGMVWPASRVWGGIPD